MDFDQEKNEKFIEMVTKYQERFDQMDYEFYDLDTPSLNRPIEQAVFVFEVLSIYDLLDETTEISNIKEYLPGLFKHGRIEGFTFLRNGVPYYISLTDIIPKEGYQIIYFGKSEKEELKKKENDLISVFQFFQYGSTIGELYRWN